jgi:hypothetical protein
MWIRRSETIITREAVMIAAGIPWHWVIIVATTRPRFICKMRLGWINLHMRRNRFEAWMIILTQRHLVILVGVRVHAFVHRYHFPQLVKGRITFKHWEKVVIPCSVNYHGFWQFITKG